MALSKEREDRISVKIDIYKHLMVFIHTDV